MALQRRGGNRFVVSNYGVHVMETAPQTAEQLATELKAALREVGSGAKICAVAVSSNDSLIRIIEQPETPREILRDAIRLNGLSLLNQEVKEFVLDCEIVTPTAANKQAKPKKEPKLKKGAPTTPAPAAAPAAPVKYLVAGMPRSRVQMIDQAFQQFRKPGIHNIQLASVCTFNAFEFANPEAFAKEAFLLVDIGHQNSTVTVGVKKELVIVRAIEYGANNLREFLVSNGAANAEEAFKLARVRRRGDRGQRAALAGGAHPRDRQFDRVLRRAARGEHHPGLCLRRRRAVQDVADHPRPGIAHSRAMPGTRSADLRDCAARGPEGDARPRLCQPKRSLRRSRGSLAEITPCHSM